MKNIILVLFLFTITSFSIEAQYGNFRKYEVAKTGHFCYFPSDPSKFEEQKSDDGLLIYVAQVDVNQNTFGLINVVFNETFANYSANDLKELLVSYLDHLKQSFNVTGATGYGYGHTLSSNPNIQGILDYWQTKEGKEMAVKAWINNQAIAFLYIVGKELPNQNIQSLFLNGFVYKK